MSSGCWLYNAIYIYSYFFVSCLFFALLYTLHNYIILEKEKENKKQYIMIIIWACAVIGVCIEPR